jgi:Rod binding domain-containing protein
MLTPGTAAASDAAAANALRAGTSSAMLAKTRQAAEQFEASFVTQMLSHMFEGVGNDPIFGGGKGEEVFKSFLLDEYGKSVSRAGGFGIADAVQKEMLRQQERRA